MDTLRDHLVFVIEFEIRHFKPRPRWVGARKWRDDEPITRRMAEQIADRILRRSGVNVQLKPDVPAPPASFRKCPTNFQAEMSTLPVKQDK